MLGWSINRSAQVALLFGGAGRTGGKLPLGKRLVGVFMGQHLSGEILCVSLIEVGFMD